MGDWGGAGKGALGGAATGAAIGSVGGPWGAAIGGGIGAVGGGLMGYFGGGSDSGGLSDAQKAMYEKYLYDLQGRDTPQLGPAAQAGYSDFRGNQTSLISQLESAASGRGPSLAAEQLKAATEKNSRNQQAFANSSRGSGATLAHFQAANNISNLGAQAAQDSAAARIAEITAAQNQLGLTLHGARGADEELSRYNASAQNAQALANLEALLREQQLKDEAIRAYYQTGQQTPGRVGEGDALLAGGIASAGAYAQRRAAQQTAQQKATIAAGGDVNTRTTNPARSNPYAPRVTR